MVWENRPESYTVLSLPVSTINARSTPAALHQACTFFVNVMSCCLFVHPAARVSACSLGATVNFVFFRWTVHARKSRATPGCKRVIALPCYFFSTAKFLFLAPTVGVSVPAPCGDTQTAPLMGKLMSFQRKCKLGRAEIQVNCVYVIHIRLSKWYLNMSTSIGYY